MSKFIPVFLLLVIRWHESDQLLDLWIRLDRQSSSYSEHNAAAPVVSEQDDLFRVDQLNDLFDYTSGSTLCKHLGGTEAGRSAGCLSVTRQVNCDRSIPDVHEEGKEVVEVFARLRFLVLSVQHQTNFFDRFVTGRVNLNLAF